MARLTIKEREAVIDIIHERLAGCASDIRDALGLGSISEAETLMDRLDSAANKLAVGLRKRARAVSPSDGGQR